MSEPGCAVEVNLRALAPSHPRQDMAASLEKTQGTVEYGFSQISEPRVLIKSGQELPGLQDPLMLRQNRMFRLYFEPTVFIPE